MSWPAVKTEGGGPVSAEPDSVADAVGVGVAPVVGLAAPSVPARPPPGLSAIITSTVVWKR
jgi:hypothetical protein